MSRLGQSRVTSVAGLAAIALGVEVNSSNAQWTAINLEGSGLRQSQVTSVLPTLQAGKADVVGTGLQHAILWSGSPTNWVDLTPGPGLSSTVNGLAPEQQVGAINGRATVWYGTPQSAVDFSIPGTAGSNILATDGQEQVGGAAITNLGPGNAYLWHGTAASEVNLHPTGAVESLAFAVANGQEGGWASFHVGGGGVVNHAALWSGSAASFLDLNPTSNTDSEILGMAPGQQVGWVHVPGQSQHAALWRGTAASRIDLNPPGAGLSELLATCGSAQVGYANTGIPHAGIWFGTPASFVDIATFLPVGQYFDSAATSIAQLNGMYYVGGYASLAGSGAHQAFLWVGVPGPGTGAVLIVAGTASLRKRPHRRHGVPV